MSGQATRGFAAVVRTSSPPPTNHSALHYKYSAPAHECVILSGLGCTQAVSGYLCVSRSLGPAYKCPLTADNNQRPPLLCSQAR